MATVSEYPTPVGTGGPLINRLIRHPTEYAKTEYLFEDGGEDVNVVPCGVTRWDLYYEGLLEAEHALLVAHFNEAKSKVNDFDFYDHHQAETFSGVQYVSADYGEHRHKATLSATVQLIRYG